MNQVVRRIIPYTYLDPEALECWLEDRAREGLFVTDYVPVFLSGHQFERRPPAPARYRIQFSKKELSRAERNAAAAQGWEYVSRTRKANLFRTEDPRALDLRRNWEDLAALRREARRLHRNSLLVFCALLLFLMVPFFFAGTVGWTVLNGLLLAGASYHAWEFWVSVLVFPLLPLLLLLELWNFAHMPKETDPPFRPKVSRLPARLRKIGQSGYQSLTTLLLLFLFAAPFLPGSSLYSPVPLSQAADLSYPLLQDLDPQGAVTTQVLAGRHLLAPALLDVRQNTAAFDGSDAYQLHLYHTRNPWIARWFARDCVTYFAHSSPVGVPVDLTASLPPHDLDFAAYYLVSAPPDFPRPWTQHILILREGATVAAIDCDGAFDLLSLFPQYAAAIQRA